MSFQIINDQPEIFHANIKVIGVGGGGGNAVEHMIDNEAKGITFITANTDQQALNRSRADVIIPLGKTGLGAGARPEVGAKAAMEASDKIREALEGTHLLFITAGMGGGTGTGATPVIADIAKQMGILTVAVVTKPFGFEGARRMRQAQAGIENLKDKVDSLIIILNDKLEEEVGEDATMLDCFAAADDVLYKACNGIAEIIHTPGLINVDFEDLKTVMTERGTAMMGTATASGPTRAHDAAERAIACPLLEGANLQGARGLLVYVTASAETMAQREVREVMSIMKNFVSKDAIQIVGTAFDDSMGDDLRVTVVATGLDTPSGAQGGGQIFDASAFLKRGDAAPEAAASPIPVAPAMMKPEPVAAPQADFAFAQEAAPNPAPEAAAPVETPAPLAPVSSVPPLSPVSPAPAAPDWTKPTNSDTGFFNVPTFLRHNGNKNE